MSQKLDVIIVGAGTAGLSALKLIKKQTQNFLLINDGPYGTTCARVGCMPSKALIESAYAFESRKKLERFGVRGSESLKINIPAVLKRVRSLRDNFVKSTLQATEQLSSKQSLQGKAKIVSPKSLEVNGQLFEFKSLIIATGSKPIVPRDWLKFEKYIVTSDTFFELEDLPQRVGVIGLGAIGLELAQAMAHLGIEVSAFGDTPYLAGLSDEKINESLKLQLMQELDLHLGQNAELLEGTHKNILVKSGETKVELDLVLAALGRRPNLDNLGLESLGIELDSSGMPSFNPRTMQIEDLPIFIAGDVNADRPLLHEAADEGYIAGMHALKKEVICYKRRTALSIVFSHPNVAIVGKRYSELDLEKTIIGEVDFSQQGRAQCAQKNYGLLRLYADKKTGLLLGAEMCAPAGEHMAHLIALAIERELDVHKFLQMPFYHPVLEEGLRTALRDLSRQLTKQKESSSDLSQCESIHK
jgi:dihydrolipoamide dehydrogenase